MQPEREDDGLWYALAAIALLTGAAAIRFAATGRTLFEDEVWVAALIRRGDLHPHTYNIPPLFYAIGRAWASLRGMSDTALREPPAAFGVLLGAIVFWAPLPRMTRFLWSVLLLFSSPLIFYSERLKQYTLEACAGTLLIVLYLRARENDALGPWLLFFTAAGASVLVLHTPVFIVMAIGLAVLLTRGWRRLLGFVVVGALAATAYFAYMAPGPSTPKLHGEMNAWFAETGRWINSPASLIANTKHWLGQAYNLTPFWWLLVIPLIALWMLTKHDIALITLTVVPPLIAAVASAFRFYPYGEVRLMIFCFPSLFLATADALATAARRVPVLLLAPLPFALIGAIRDPYNATYMGLSDLRTMFATVARSAPTETIYVDPSEAAPLAYYYPELRPRLRIGSLQTTEGAGWYIERGRGFDPRGAGIVIREGNIVAAHVP